MEGCNGCNLLLFTLLAGLLVPGITAQTPSASDAVAGARPGTQRFNVTFAARDFDLREYTAAVAAREPAPVVEAIVRDLQLRARAAQEPFRKSVEALGGTVVHQFWLIHAATIEIAPAQLPAVQRLANVAFVHPDRRVEPASGRRSLPPLIATATGAGHHNADAEQRLGNRATGLGIAILDTSQDEATHGPRRPHQIYYRNGDRTNHTAGGFDGSRLLANVALGSQPANSAHPHGIGVAAIAAGEVWRTAGADRGHAADANLVGYSLCEFGGTCASTLAIQALAWQRAAADRATFNLVCANMSYENTPDPLDVSQQALDACALHADILPVTAAANDGASTARSSSSANGIAVAACDHAKVVAGFSSRGPLAGDPTRTFPDLTACGVATVMPRFGNENADWVADGTSMASPQVCGAAALVRSAMPAANARETKAVLLCATEDIAAQNSGLDRNAFGVGFLRDDLACQLARTPGAVLSDALTGATGRKTHTISVVQSVRYHVALVWHRHNLTATSWSNLDLRVLNGTSVVASSQTPRNLYEKLAFLAPLTGSLTLEVSHLGLEQANVPYSIAWGPVGGPAGSTAASYAAFGAGCGGSVNAGACHVVPASLAAAFGNTTSNLPFSYAPSRYQQLVRSADLPAAFACIGLGLRQDEQFSGFPGRTVDLEIHLGYSTRDVATMSPVFASNFDAGAPVVVLPRTQVVLPALPPTLPTQPSVFFAGIPFTTPFAYVPTPGRNLVLEVINRGNSNGNQPFSYPLDADNGASTARVWATPPTALSGVLGINLGLALCLRGTGPGLPPLLGHGGLPRVNSAFHVTLDQALPGSVALLLLGSNRQWNGIGLPLDLAPAGAPGCALLVGATGMQAVATTAGGLGLATVVIPGDPSLVGARFYNQFAVVDPAANALQLAFSNGGAALVGSQ